MASGRRWWSEVPGQQGAIDLRRKRGEKCETWKDAIDPALTSRWLKPGQRGSSITVHPRHTSDKKERKKDEFVCIGVTRCIRPLSALKTRREMSLPGLWSWNLTSVVYNDVRQRPRPMCIMLPNENQGHFYRKYWNKSHLKACSDRSSNLCSGPEV